ncbi:unnamed protein product [Effrenium voratum]|uniref:Uncharacterized protein n=1 Tax=Effrenium voratum TaxID=2562239 RepID=A0AA36HRW9_9DINO|nr:unnamed protein product [Effrenium voratum]
MADAPDDPQFIASMASAAKLLTQDGERQMQCLLHQASDEARTRVATAALAALLAEPWSYDFTRLLLCADAEAIGEVSKVGAGELPDSLTRWPSICSVAQARAVYEPALQRRVKQLLIAGADANGARGEGPPQLPLMCCAMNGWTELAKCLLTAQADVTLCDACGSTALHYAAIHHEATLAETLLDSTRHNCTAELLVSHSQGDLLVLPYQAAALQEVATLEVQGSAQTVTILAATTRASDDYDDVEPTTFVPDCQSYERLPCSCHHVLLSPYENGFWPGFDHLWQKASLERLLTLQQVYFREQWGFRFIGHHFWHSAGFGNFKNGLDTPYFTATSYAQYFPEACHVEPACRLTQAFSMSLNWVVTLKQFSVFPEGSQVEAYIPHLAEMADAQHVEAWRGAPWYYLLEKPHWAEAFLFLLQELEELLTGQPVQESAEDERFARSVARMGSDVSEGGACREVAALREVSRESRGPERFVAMARLQHAVFQPPCFQSLAHSMVIFGAAVRQLLPVPDAPWPFGPAEPAETSALWRLCGQPGVAHRRVGQAELHFLSGDVVVVGNELQVELLWTATSDDDCIMVGTNFHNNGSLYYSFMHTLPQSFLMHWECSFGLDNGTEQFDHHHAASTSLSGFTLITACRVPQGTASSRLWTETRASAGIELQLRSAWAPEPLRLCPRPRVRRALAACSAPLHDAERVHEILPHALEDWLNYHFAIGIEHFTVFDTDGSYEPYLRRFVDVGLVSYRGRFPGLVAPKLGLASAGLKRPEQQRRMLMEPHALELCVWENRQVADWVVVVHSFEEYLHSPLLSSKLQEVPLSHLIRQWAEQVPGTALFELFQEPMGGARRDGQTVFSRWTKKRGLEMSDAPGVPGLQADSLHFQPFAWIVDPVNVIQTAVHFAQARANGHKMIVLPKQTLRVNHYIDLGSNTTRCLDELGGCNVEDDTLLWAEERVLSMRA